jgi:phospholipid/cholesterol/gamma-HCH transport system ATP-binding protein
MIRIRNLHKTIKRQRILRGVDLDIVEGETLVVIGRSGGGKSILLKHMLGLMQPDSGEVLYHNRNLVGLTEEELLPLRKEMGMVFQNGALFDSLTVGQNVGFSLIEKERLPAAEVSRRVEEALAMVGLRGQERKMPAELSGGMKKRVALARAAISQPKLMLYDEPTAGLDPMMSDSINKLILRLGSAQKMTAVVVTHDMVSAYAIANKIAMLHEGRIYCVMTPEEIQRQTDPVIHDFVHGISGETIDTPAGA